MGTNPQPCPGIDVTLEPGDIEIGAVELKDASSDDRVAVVNATPATTALGVATREVPTGGTATQPSDIAVTAADGVVLAANAARKSATVQNTGAQPIRVRVDGAAATGSRGIKLTAGQPLTIEQPFCPTTAIHSIRDATATGDSTVAVLEIV